MRQALRTVSCSLGAARQIFLVLILTHVTCEDNCERRSMRVRSRCAPRSSASGMHLLGTSEVAHQPGTRLARAPPATRSRGRWEAPEGGRARTVAWYALYSCLRPTSHCTCPFSPRNGRLGRLSPHRGVWSRGRRACSGGVSHPSERLTSSPPSLPHRPSRDLHPRTPLRLYPPSS